MMHFQFLIKLSLISIFDKTYSYQKTSRSFGEGNLCLELTDRWKNHQEALLLTCLNLIPAWISNHMPNKVRDEIIHPFLNFNGSIAEV